MSAEYQAVLWNRNKRLYDLAIAVGAVVFLGLFVGIGISTRTQTTIETLLIRGLGAGALLLLHLVLAIGPLCRLDRRFLPLLYNRRHLGVCMFLLAAAHGGFSVVQFHGLGVLNPLVSVLASNGNYDSLTQFPFQALGLAALVILFLMAATSHDFWLANLTAPVWKSLHMLVYVAYGLVLVHVALGSLQAAERPTVLAGLLGVGFVAIGSLHLVAGWRQRVPALAATAGDEAVDVCAVSDILLDRARIFVLSGERVAVFRYGTDDGERIAAVSNVCQHQNGPLGEGRVTSGCITCPWHGYQYRPEDGCSPPPFTETIPTFNVRVEGGRVLVDPRPNPPGTHAEPASLETRASSDPSDLGTRASRPHPGPRSDDSTAPADTPEEAAMTGNRRDECHPCARLTGARTGSRVTRVAPPGFYVGYLDETPPGISRFARRAVIGVLLLAAALGAGLALLLERFDEGVFEYGTVRDYEGELLVDPHPRIRTEGGPAEGYLLVGVGKHGLDVNEEPSPPWLPALSRKLQLSGTLIQNPEAAMLEVHSLKHPEGRTSEEPPTEPDSLDDPGTGGSTPDGESDDAAAEVPPGAQIDRVYLRGDTLVGEIVDTKCYLGAMKPGRGKPHRDCASLCIRGGIPAALLVRTENGERRLVHLVNLAGQPLGQELLEWVGQPVEVTGQLRRRDNRLILRTFVFDRATAAASVRPYPARPSPTGSGP